MLVAALGVTACSGGGDAAPTTTQVTSVASDAGAAPTSLPLRIDLVAPAMDAVDAALGGPQEYFEVNATPQLVNLFVARERGATVASYVYRPDGELEEPAEPQPASGPTFAAADVAFGDEVLAGVLADLTTSLPRLFAVNATADGAGVEYRAYFTSTQGGQVAVLLGADGAVLSTETS